MLNWYLQSGNDSDVVYSTRIRLARNINGFKFVNRYTKKDAINIIQLMENNIISLGYGLKLIRLNDLDNITKLSLVEKHLISPEFAYNKSETGAIIINDDENICIMVNEEDHIRLQIFATGLELENALNLAIEIDKKLEELIPYSYNNKYGFLTSCPTNVGTGLRASVMVHLPALSKTGNIRKVLEVVNSFDMNIRGIYGEGSNSQADIYQISNKQSLGISEEDVIKNLKIITDKVIEQERLARKILTKNGIELEDKVYRAYGVLVNSKKLSSKECNILLSDVKLGVDLGIIKELNDSKIKKIETYTKPANLQKYIGQTLDVYNRDIKRAEVIKEIISQ
ncbi:MAG: protein arginine kinase [Clostridia bacterium]|nr:protein arginine kinase [Clostridia bacterium]